MLNRYTFFLDRALESYDLRDALKEIGVRVKMHREDFKDDELDEVWLPVIARREWIILSKDDYNYLERRAIINANGRAFLLVRCDLPGKEQAAVICKALPEIVRILDLNPPPLIAKIYRDGSVHLTDIAKLKRPRH